MILKEKMKQENAENELVHSSKPLDECQLQQLASSYEEIPRVERMLIRSQKKIIRLIKIMKRLSNDPRVLLRKLNLGKQKQDHSTFSLVKKNNHSDFQAIPSVLGLKPGDRVRVKSREEIQRTLDDRGKCEGLAYMGSTMDNYSGGIYTVKKRINYFFDEKKWKLVKLKNVVILEGVYIVRAR